MMKKCRGHCGALAIFAVGIFLISRREWARVPLLLGALGSAGRFRCRREARLLSHNHLLRVYESLRYRLRRKVSRPTESGGYP